MRLMDLLKYEQELLSQLMQTLKEENKALVDDDIPSLNKIVKTKETLSNSVRAIESQRISGYGDINLSSIVFKLESEGKTQEAHEIDSIGTDMQDKIFKIKEQNETNQLLIRQSLNYVKTMMNILCPKKNKLYNPSGEIKSDIEQRSTLDISI